MLGRVALWILALVLTATALSCSEPDRTHTMSMVRLDVEEVTYNALQEQQAQLAVIASSLAKVDLNNRESWRHFYTTQGMAQLAAMGFRGGSGGDLGHLNSGALPVELSTPTMREVARGGIFVQTALNTLEKTDMRVIRQSLDSGEVTPEASTALAHARTTIGKLLEIQDRLVEWRNAPQQAEAAAQEAANLAAQLIDWQRASP